MTSNFWVKLCEGAQVVSQGFSRTFSLPVVSVSPDKGSFIILLLIFSVFPLQMLLLLIVKSAATVLGFS